LGGMVTFFALNDVSATHLTEKRKEERTNKVTRIQTVI
jgi:hypothetical protein